MDIELRAEVRVWKVEVEDRLARLEAAIAELTKPKDVAVSPTSDKTKSKE